MEKELDKIRKKINSFGKNLCKEELLPLVKKWMKKNNIKELYLFNGRSWCKMNDGEEYHPDELADKFDNYELANEMISLSNAVGYELGFDLPQTIKLK